MEAFLIGWWFVVILGLPVLFYGLGGRLSDRWSRRKRAVLAAGALAFLGLAWTPLSLPGVAADRFVLGAAVLTLVAALGALVGPRTRTALTAVLSVLMTLAFAVGGFAIALMFVFVGVLPDRSIVLPCGRSARLTNTGMAFTSEFTEIVIVRHPLGPVLEIEHSRTTIRGLSADDVSVQPLPGGGACDASFLAEGREIWRVP